MNSDDPTPEEEEVIRELERLADEGQEAIDEWIEEATK